jgi:UDP:flavonoid glycosyltransferase YjiC (YdhE family)
MLACTPQVIKPVLQFYDQLGWATLLESRGLGVHCDGAGSVHDFRTALARALALPRGPVAEAARALRAERGLERARGGPSY